jgi:cytochrome c-type biogenesis protein CcmH
VRRGRYAVLRAAGAGLLAAGLLVAVAQAQSRETSGASAPAGAGAADVRQVIGEPHGRGLSGTALEAATTRVASLLRCPVCQGLSVADSPTGLAQGMKQQVRDLLAAGYDDEQVLSYFEKSYGEFVRLEPPRRGINWLVWLAPAVVLVGGGFVVAQSWRRLRNPLQPVVQGPPAADTETAAEVSVGASPATTTAVDPDLEPYVLRVREMAYGWPGGRPPGSEGPGPSNR